MSEGSLITFRARGFRWKARPELKALINADQRFVLPDGAQVVKEGPARRVWRFETTTGGVQTAFYVKECLLPEWRDCLKYLFQPSKAAREFRALGLLRERGVSVPEPLGVGVRRRGLFLERSILVTRALPDAEPLDRYVLTRIAAAGGPDVRAFTRKFAAFVRQVHDAGLFHRDFHAANILARGQAQAVEFFLVDLDDVTISERLRYGERLENLGIMGRFFCPVVPRHWRLRFLESYAGGQFDLESAARMVERISERGLRSVWAKKDRRICGNNKYFSHVRASRLTGHAARTAEAAAAIDLFAGGDPFKDAEALLKDGRSSTVGVFKLGDDAGGGRVVIKRRNRERTWKRFLDSLRTSRATKGFFIGAAFENRRLPTPKVLAALDCRRLGCLEGSYLVLEYVEGAQNLARVVVEGQASALFQRMSRDRKGFLKRLAYLLRRMHFCGFSMRDLRAANILLYPSGDGVGMEIIDLDDARLCRAAVPESRAIRNIARLYADALYLNAVSRREAVEFLRDYLGPCDRARFLRWVSEVSRYARAKRRLLKLKYA